MVSAVNFVLGLLLAPLLPGIINRTKAFVAGRRGQPFLQAYYDIWKLLRKGAVYSDTTTWVFRAGPVVGLAAMVVAVALAGSTCAAGLLSFSGDFLLLAGLLGLARFFTVIAALDTGSSFEGMGASREVLFSALAEPALLLGIAALAAASRSLSLAGLYGAVYEGGGGMHAVPAAGLVAAALLLVFLAENARIPIDDPNTHLELTMIHEVMVLDHSGPDLAFINYTAALKLWVVGALLVGLLPSWGGLAPVPGTLWLLGKLAALAVVTGLIESTMARLRLARVPQLLVAASVFSILAMLLVVRWA